MNIRGLIDRQKQSFHERKRNNIANETAKLEQERIRQGELAEVNAQKQAASKEVNKFKEYNKEVEGPSRLQRFGAGLSNTINKAKEVKGKVSPRSKAKGGANLRGINQGSRGGFNFGGQSGLNIGGGSSASPFNFGSTPAPKKKEIKKNKTITIQINR